MRLLRIVMWIAMALIVLIAIGWWTARPKTPDAFYSASGNLPPEPGALLRQTPFGNDVPAGANAWRILYTTTRTDGVPALGSALVLSSKTPPNGPRPIIAWTHGTTGIVPGCAPSLLKDPFAYVPALATVLKEGWIFVATDYIGQGTQGPHTYLVGEGEGRAALDAIRATRGIEGLDAGDRVVLWGHSQGGHAAMWTGIVAPGYAPDVQIAGIAAMAPATDLRGLIERIQYTLVGRMMTSYTLRGYSENYPDVPFEEYTSGWSGLLARDMSTRCLDGAKVLFSVGTSAIAGRTIFDISPTTGPLGARLGENTPTAPIPQPLLIAQGEADDLVLPDVQAQFVKDRCAANQVIDYRRYQGRDHLTVLKADSAFVDDLVEWTKQRIAGEEPISVCRDTEK